MHHSLWHGSGSCGKRLCPRRWACRSAVAQSHQGAGRSKCTGSLYRPCELPGQKNASHTGCWGSVSARAVHVARERTSVVQCRRPRPLRSFRRRAQCCQCCQCCQCVGAGLGSPLLTPPDQRLRVWAVGRVAGVPSQARQWKGLLARSMGTQVGAMGSCLGHEIETGQYDLPQVASKIWPLFCSAMRAAWLSTWQPSVGSTRRGFSFRIRRCRG